MDEQTDKGNQYTYNERTGRQGQSIYLRWTNKQNMAINIPTMAGDRPWQSIYLRWPETDNGNQYTYDGRRQTRAINIPTMNEKTDKGNRYTYDGITDRQGQSIYLQWTNRQKRAINIPTMDEQTDNFKVNQYTYD
jgi:hypothetical protein